MTCIFLQRSTSCPIRLEKVIHWKRQWECIKKFLIQAIRFSLFDGSERNSKKYSIEKQLKRTLEVTKVNFPLDEDRTIENGYMLDENTIGFLNWRLGDVSEAKKIDEQLKAVVFESMLSTLLKIEQS